MQMYIEQNISKAMQTVMSAATRQVDYAAKNAINDVAYQAQKDSPAHTEKIFDKPTRSTLKHLFVVPARKWTAGAIEAKVAIKDNFPGGVSPNMYLAANIRGGSRKDKRSEVALHAIARAVGVKLDGSYQTVIHPDYRNAHGNITKARIKDILMDLKAGRGGKNAKGKKTRYFIMPNTEKNRNPGVYIRKSRAPAGKPLRMVIAFIKLKDYKPRYDFHGYVIGEVKRNFTRRFKWRYAQALASMR